MYIEKYRTTCISSSFKTNIFSTQRKGSSQRSKKPIIWLYSRLWKTRPSTQCMLSFNQINDSYQQLITINSLNIVTTVSNSC
jgi:hypothetical protein